MNIIDVITMEDVQAYVSWEAMRELNKRTGYEYEDMVGWGKRDWVHQFGEVALMLEEEVAKVQKLEKQLKEIIDKDN